MSTAVQLEEDYIGHVFVSAKTFDAVKLKHRESLMLHPDNNVKEDIFAIKV